ncbi:Uncharacterized protein SCF082_LOCUS17998 [Durusdinium trenchii]|uniref:DNA (cytosine-5-)-methyltransferase n=1 Tax=Durusdinium trenchii TaxID=1381693 RepID=A0ABP0KLN4_9DINO
MGWCTTQELRGGYARKPGDIILIAKKRMADAEPYAVVVVMTEDRARALELGFQQPLGVAARRPLSERVKKNIKSVAPKCFKHNVINQDALSYLTRWSQGDWPCQPRPTAYKHLVHRWPVPFALSLATPSWEIPSRSKHVDLTYAVEGGDDGDPSDDDDDDDAVLAEGSESEILEASDDGLESPAAAPRSPLPCMSVSNIIEELLKVDDVKGCLQSTHAALPSGDGAIKVKVASICSGLGVAEMIFDQLNPALKELLHSGRALKFENEFMCEIDTWKSDWISKAFGAKIIFEDMRCLGSGYGKDAVTQQYLQVPKVAGLTIGYPCKSISSQNGSPKSFLDESSTTGGGFRALLAYCDYDEDLEWVITENVRNLTHSRKQFGGECPIHLQDSELEKRGFIPTHALITSSEYGVPQSRTRCWGLYVKATQFRQFGPDPRSLFLKLTCPPTPIDKVVDPALAIERPSTQRAASGKKWEEDFITMQKKLWEGINQKQKHNVAVKTNLKALQKKGLPLTARELSIAAVAVTILQQRGMDPFAHTMIIQVDQNYERNTFCSSNPWLCPCLIPNGKYIISSQWRLLSGQEKLKLQGLGLDDITKYKLHLLTDKQQSDLAGNSFTSGVCTAAILTILCCWQPSKRVAQ